MDLTRPLTLPDGFADAVYHSHVLEHLDSEAAARLLAECHRVLKSGGILRVVLPDLETLARNYLTALEQGEELAHEWAVIYMLDQMVRTHSEGQMGEFLRTRPWRTHPTIPQWVGGGMEAALRGKPTAPRWFLRRPRHPWTTLRFALARFWLNAREASLLREVRFRTSGEIHRWMYDRLSLPRLLRQAGFPETKAQDATMSDIADFASYGLDLDKEKQARHRGSLYIEARKA